MSQARKRAYEGRGGEGCSEASVDWTGVLIGAAIGNVIGGVITIVVSWFFYVRAARGLQREAEELKQQTQLIMRFGRLMVPLTVPSV